ncbi:hypothetical protein ACLOJK_002814 [Asimina triloba]
MGFLQQRLRTAIDSDGDERLPRRASDGRAVDGEGRPSSSSDPDPATNPSTTPSTHPAPPPTSVHATADHAGSPPITIDPKTNGRSTEVSFQKPNIQNPQNSKAAHAGRRGSVFPDSDERRTTAWRGGDASGQRWADGSDGAGGQAVSAGTTSMAIGRRWLQWRHGSSDGQLRR